ncbi:hypothetical protein F383_04951 [Gossypium arboreum]|uniref:Uncharacterized protein n=1 Tax=Gossypium arboreum TaxID=29729 RepID=A0A0B0NF79_GOSAR|nr:hypothetical protein F383_04951 [Gossypium arboreum]
MYVETKTIGVLSFAFRRLISPFRRELLSSLSADSILGCASSI